MKKTILALICISLMILDNTLVPFFSINTYYTSLLLVFILCYSMVSDKWDALGIGVFAGLLQDIYFFQGFGVNAFVNMILCLLAYSVGVSIFKERKFIPVVATFFLASLKYLIIFIILYILGIYVIFCGILYVGVTSMIVAFFFYKPIYKLSNKDYMKRDWKFNE